MKTKLKLVSVILLASSFVAVGETEDRLNKRFAVQPGGSLEVDIQFGSIEVKPGGVSEVVVDVVRKISRPTRAEEEDYLADNPIQIGANGNNVSVQSRSNLKEGTNWRGKRLTDIKYTITVPAKFDLQLKTGAGAITATGITGDAKARSSGGGLTFASLHGPLSATTGAGAIRVTDCEGDLHLKTAGGGIEITGGNGTLESTTGGGQVAVRDFKGPVQMKSAGGGLTIENIVGRIEGQTGGGGIAARFQTPPTDTVRLSTAGGGVTLQVPESAAFDLDATTTGGSVSTDLPVEGAPQGKKAPRNRLKGPVNGGGKTVTLRSGGGSIKVSKT